MAWWRSQIRWQGSKTAKKLGVEVDAIKAEHVKKTAIDPHANFGAPMEAQREKRAA